MSARVVLALALLAVDVAAQGGAVAERDVRLLLSLSIDQMTPEQLDRLAPWLAGGLGRMLREGREFTCAELRYGETETGPGHACIGTGLEPARHGIVANDWIARDQSRTTYCYEDPDARAVTSAGPSTSRASSPRNSRADGFAEQLRAVSPASRIAAISVKDRSAIGMSGRRADLALWWDKRSGGYLSSSWYASELPAWVREWNAGWLERLARSEFGGGWRCVLPERFEGSRTAPDEREGERGRPGERAFPHRAPRFEGALDKDQLALAAAWVYDGPAGDVCSSELARIAQRELGLGERGAIDLLCLSLSSCDTVGHGYGFDSVEVTDVLLRADRLLGALFEQLDERVGAGRWIASLTADHGVMALPETLAARGIDAGRWSTKLLRDALELVRPRLAARFGADFYLAHHSRGVRLSLAGMHEAGVSPAEVRARYVEELLAAGASWIEHAVSFDELESVARHGAAARTRLIALEAASFDEERTCDIVVLWRRNHLFGVAAGSSHGTPHDYDRAIPLLFYGPGVAAGRSAAPASSIDVLPTLMSLAGLPVPPGLDGRVLDVAR